MWRSAVGCWNARWAGVSDLVAAGDEDGARREMTRQLVEGAEPSGIVYLVGAGPGAADLLTIRAHRLLGEADVIVHDRLIGEDVLDMARRDAERIYVGKARAHHCVPQEGINDLLIRLAREGRKVVRLKGGDPFIFGRGGEEAEALAEAGVAFEVVPVLRRRWVRGAGRYPADASGGCADRYVRDRAHQGRPAGFGLRAARTGWDDRSLHGHRYIAAVAGWAAGGRIGAGHAGGVDRAGRVPAATGVDGDVGRPGGTSGGVVHGWAGIGAGGECGWTADAGVRNGWEYAWDGPHPGHSQ